MQEKISKQTLSRYRQEIRKIMDDIDRLSSRCLFEDQLIQGSPGEVFRKCGKPNCKCMGKKEDRHGPYYVIQIYRAGKQRQIALKKDQKDLWDKAKHYQFQMECAAKLKECCNKIQDLVNEVIEKRIEEFPK